MKTLAPGMHGIIDRRMLINFRVRPGIACKLLPARFRPKLTDGWAMAGICLIRLREIRPRGFPAAMGIASENAAHRIAVEWDEAGFRREGVFIPRRDTSSSLQAFAGGRFFPGVHHLADFEVRERNEEFYLRMRSRDDGASIEIKAARAPRLPSTSVFKSLTEASDFFMRGSVGYSATRVPGCCDGLELVTKSWRVEPLAVSFVRSSFFENQKRFPEDSIHFDSALLMENIEHEWRTLPQMKGHT
jgi:hypothetical protein